MRTAWWLLILTSCAPATTRPALVAAPVLARASATLTIEPGEDTARPEGAPVPAPELTTAELVAALGSPAAREGALTVTGQPRASEVSVREDGRMVEVSVASPTEEGAVALCNALVGAASARGANDASGGYFTAERARLERELVALSRSLALLPRASAVSGPRDAALTAVRVVRIEVASGDASMLVALRRMTLEARVADADLQRRALGVGHPDRMMSAARLAFLDAAVEKQRDVERGEAALVESMLTALPPRAPADVTGRALAERLRRLPLERVTSLDARELEDLALAWIDARAEEPALATRYGEAHPRRRELDDRVRRIEATYERERAVMVQFLERGSLPTVDARPDALQDRARGLAIALARLDDWASKRRPARVVTVASCRAVSP